MIELDTIAAGLNDFEIEAFHRDGFLGPRPRFASEYELNVAAAQCLEVVHHPQPHPLYGRFSVRDWHIVSPDILSLVTNPSLVADLRSLAGHNLNLWRSKIFHKRPWDGETGWHQEWGAFNGEEIGNDTPSLQPAVNNGSWWNLTVWIALTDVSEYSSPMKFVRGSHRTRYPIEMVPMPESEFWHDPFIGANSVEDLVERARTYSLVLDIDTSHLFDGVDTSTMCFEAAQEHVIREMGKLKAAKTVEFEDKTPDIITLPMKRGEYVIFTERTMHGAIPNDSSSERLAINIRVTTTDTLVYPQHLVGDYIDGSNINIEKHQCILLSGYDRSGGRNVFSHQG